MCKLKGYVVCLLRELGEEFRQNKAPYILSYYNRINVCGVTAFENFRVLSSKLAAGIPAERKQLLLYKLECTPPECNLDFCGPTDTDKSIIQQALHKGMPFDNNAFPFALENKYALACITILRLDNEVKRALTTEEKPPETALAEYIYSLLGKSEGISYECFGTLGSEDLCMISLSDSFAGIYETVNRLRMIKLRTQDNEVRSLLANTYSVLILTGNEKETDPDLIWGGASATISLSLKGTLDQGSSDFINKLKEKLGQDIYYPRIGEYDISIRCEAKKITHELFSKDGLLFSGHTEYRQQCYQTSTVIINEPVKSDASAPEHTYWEPGIASFPAHSPLARNDGDAYKKIKDTIHRVRNALWTDNEHEKEQNTHWLQYLAYVEQSLFLLSKDYLRILESDISDNWKKTLNDQFDAVMDSICYYANYVRELRGTVANTDDEVAAQNYITWKDRFSSYFEDLISSLHQSISDVSQIDDLFYDKLTSNLHNTGTYIKILGTYYGIIQTIISVINIMPREPGTKTREIVPIVQFGLAPKIQSKPYVVRDAYDPKGCEQYVTVFVMPYQALSRIPRYVGPLFHEVFHYCVPESRYNRNSLLGMTLSLLMLPQYTAAFFDELGKFADCKDIVGQSVIDFLLVDGETPASQYVSLVDSAYEELQDWIYLDQDTGKKNHKQSFLRREFQNILLHCFDPFVEPDSYPSIYEIFIERLLEHIEQHREAITHAMGDSVLVMIDQAYTKLNLGGNTPVEEKRSRLFSKIHNNAIQNRQDIFYKWQISFDKITSAWREVFPDLLDICLLIPETVENYKNERILQYLWQIYNVRCDTIFFPFDSNVSEENELRVGIIIDILWRSANDELTKLGIDELVSEFEVFLKNELAYSGENRYKDAMINQSCKSYRRYLNIVDPFGSVIAERIGRLVPDQLNHLSELLRSSDQYSSLIKRLDFLYESFQKYCSIYKDPGDHHSQMFGLCLKILQEFQEPWPSLPLSNAEVSVKDVSFGCITRRSGSSPEARYHYINKVNYGLWADTPGMLFEHLRSIYANYPRPDPKNDQHFERRLWFRGESDVSRKTVPTLMRTDTADTDESLPDIMRRIVRFAKSKIYSFVDTAHFNDADWMGLLQHYGIPTPLLDWSEDFCTSLFFATKHWIDGEKTEKDAVIYVLDPFLLNTANRIVSGEQKLPSVVNLTWFLQNREAHIDLPLLSEEEDFDRFWCHASLTEKNVNKKTKAGYPIAGLIKINNDRMHAQSGTFLFPHLYNPALKEGRRETFLTHDHIQLQEEYIEFVYKKTNILPPQFLWKLVLNHSHWKAFAEITQALGMSQFSVYPEFGQISEDVKWYCKTGLK